jgi:uncharacterized protein
MQRYIARRLLQKLIEKLDKNPAVVMLGPRQCGKSTLAKQLLTHYPNALYLDLELPSDENKLQNPEAFFKANSDRLICIDEIQRAPNLFPVLRSIIDQRNRATQFLLLGSASGQLIKQSTESLAGRLALVEISPFVIDEIDQSEESFRNLWLKGGFPRSFLEPNERHSFDWRQDYLKTVVERDIPQHGFNIPSRTLFRLLQMCAHNQGQLLNSSKLGQSLDLSYHSVKYYLDILVDMFVVSSLPPFYINLKKRLVKSPKIYIRDSGLLHTLLSIYSVNELMGHPVFGSSWEGFVVEQIRDAMPDMVLSFYRTASGTEIDLILEGRGKRIGVECKASLSPRLDKGQKEAFKDLELDELWLISPIQDRYPIDDKIEVCSLRQFLEINS